jgi:uncharacterized integral membrane protein
MSSGSPPELRQSAEVAKPPSRKITPRQAGSAVAVVLVVVFALINFQNATMHWVVGTTHTPLIVLVAFCVLIGLAVGFVLGRRSRAEEHAAKKRR